jgi:hypothetical protein
LEKVKAKKASQLSKSSLAANLGLKGLPIWQRWKEIVGPHIALHARPYRIRNGVLLIQVDQPVWMQELHFLKEELKTKLNALLQDFQLENLFFLPGRYSFEEERETVPEKLILEERDQAKVREILEKIPDPEIRGAMKGLVERFVWSQTRSRKKD